MFPEGLFLYPDNEDRRQRIGSERVSELEGIVRWEFLNDRFVWHPAFLLWIQAVGRKKYKKLSSGGWFCRQMKTCNWAYFKAKEKLSPLKGILQAWRLWLNSLISRLKFSLKFPQRDSPSLEVVTRHNQLTDLLIMGPQRDSPSLEVVTAQTGAATANPTSNPQRDSPSLEVVTLYLDIHFHMNK